MSPFESILAHALLAFTPVVLAHGINTEPCMRIESGSGQYACLQNAIEEETDHGGPEAAVKFLNEIQEDPQFREDINDHQLAHRIGRITARTIGTTGDVFLRCPKDFAFGCQHGFFEEMLVTADSPLKAARMICESVTTKGMERVRDIFFCFHGIGHGLMMAKQNDIHTSLEVCDALPSLEARQGCRQGVFMEVINAFARGEIPRSIFGETQLALCEESPVEHQWACAITIAPYLLYSLENDWQKVAAACADASEYIQKPCAWNIGQMATDPAHYAKIARKNLSEEAIISTIPSLCAALDPKLETSCIGGAAEQLMNHQKQNLARALCDGTKDEMSDTCFSTIGNILIAQGWSLKRRSEFCNGIAEPIRSLCIEGDDSSPVPSEHQVPFRERILQWLRSIFAFMLP